MKKCIFIFICLLFLSGCNATYEININNNEIKEKITLIETNQSMFDVVNDSGWSIRQTIESILSNDEFVDKGYSVKSLNDSNRLGLEYRSNNLESLINSSAINQCYINPSYKLQDGIATLNTGNNFKCYEYYDNLETIKIVLKTNHKVISSNAHEIENGKYIWNLTEESNKQIEFVYDTNTVEKNYILIISIILVALAIISIISYYVYTKVKSKNEI